MLSLKWTFSLENKQTKQKNQMRRYIVSMGDIVLAQTYVSQKTFRSENIKTGYDFF